ncbi:MAG: alpha/beta fold hydrolase [Candidatus Binatia bacterium]
MSSHIIETALGPVECAIVGQGPAVLIIHGCPGGYDQGLIATRLTKGHRFKFIALSRPGYLRTPLEVGATPEAQADAYAGLLDALQIPKAAVIGISGGGPSALQFALRHPNRCQALVTVSAISRCLSPADIKNCKSLVRRMLFAIDLAFKLGRALVAMAGQKCRKTLVSMGTKTHKYEARELNPQENLELVLELLRSFGVISPRTTGLENDMVQLTTMPIYPLEWITSPTLVMHGSADQLVPLAHAEFIASTVPHAKLITVENGGHLFFATHREQVVPELIEFLKLSTRDASSESQAMETNDARLATSGLSSRHQLVPDSLSGT